MGYDGSMQTKAAPVLTLSPHAAPASIPNTQIDGSFTLALRLKVPTQPGTLISNAARQPILTVEPLISPMAYRERKRFDSDLALSFTWQTTSLEERLIPEFFTQPENFVWHVKPDNLEKGTLTVQAPIDLVGPDRWIDLVVRHNGLHLHIFADGVLIDEEWVQGPTISMGLPLTIEQNVEYESLQLWNEPLSNAAIEAISGTELARARDAEIHPPHTGTWQYWRPKDYNAYVGDVMPYFDGERLHVYYLYDRRHHLGKWGTGVHTFGHISTPDMVNWTEHPDAIAPDRPEEHTLGTGHIIENEGTYYLYWIEHARRLPFKESRYHADNVFVALGKDTETFVKQPEPWLPLNYGQGGDINTMVFKDPDNGKFYQVVGGGVATGEDIVEHRLFESTDLKTWEKSYDMPSLGMMGVCPSYIHWRGYHYLFSVGFYYYSDQAPSKDKIQRHPNMLERGLTAPMICHYHDDRALLVGFKSQGAYANRLVVRELVDLGDGVLGIKWIEEMMPERTAPIALDNTTLQLTPDSMSAHLSDLPFAYHAKFTVTPSQGAIFRALVRCNTAHTEGADISWITAEKKLEFRDKPGTHIHFTRIQPPLGLTDLFEGLDHPFKVELLVFDDFVDIAFAGRYARIFSAPEDHSGLAFFATAGEVTMTDLVIRPLAQ